MADASDMVQPLHAESFFSVARTGEIHERLCFEYTDPGHYYRRVLQDEDAFEKEIETLSGNMQYYLDKERVEINGRQVKSFVSYVDIFLKGESDIVAVVYLIDFTGRFSAGNNKIETWLEEETAPYDFEIMWRFPLGTHEISIESLLDYEVYDSIVVLWAEEGDRVGGYERMEFNLAPAKPGKTSASED
jgi:hypothetical protein